MRYAIWHARGDLMGKGSCRIRLVPVPPSHYSHIPDFPFQSWAWSEPAQCQWRETHHSTMIGDGKLAKQ